MRSWRRIFWFGIFLFALWIITIYIRIGISASGEPPQPAGAIVVFGAAQYDGHPSPVFRSRLDHAFELWQQHYAPIIITTGGHARDARFSEGGVGKHYLEERGVASVALIAETESRDTDESARRVSAILRRLGVADCIAVSDGYHLFRIERMMRREGIVARGSARRELHTATLRQRVPTKVREAFAYTAWILHLQ
ncbi:MAG: YdcF family protein [Acidobacteriaceae bacterium]